MTTNSICLSKLNIFDSTKKHMYNADTMVDRHKQEPEEVEMIEDEETTGEELEVEEIEAEGAKKMKHLRDSLKACEAEKIQYLEDLQRSRADFLNSKRRLEEQFERDRERVIDRLLTDLLPLIDSFDTAMSDAAALERMDEKWRSGITAIHNQLMSFLKSNKVEEIATLGKPFDPHEHEAIANTPVTSASQADTVVAVLQKGFKRGDTIIRPAKVAVGITA